MRNFLTQNWSKLTDKLPHSSSAYFEQLIKRYAAPDRHYHNLKHIETLLQLTEAQIWPGNRCLLWVSTLPLYQTAPNLLSLPRITLLPISSIDLMHTSCWISISPSLQLQWMPIIYTPNKSEKNTISTPMPNTMKAAER